MPPRLADVPKRIDAPASSKYPFDRDPLLIPELFADMRPRWYQRRAIRVSIGVSAVIVLVLAIAIRLYTVEALARRFSALVSR